MEQARRRVLEAASETSDARRSQRLSAPWLGRRPAVAVASVLAVCGAVALTTWLGTRPDDQPANAPPPGQERAASAAALPGPNLGDQVPAGSVAARTLSPPERTPPPAQAAAAPPRTAHATRQVGALDGRRQIIFTTPGGTRLYWTLDTRLAAERSPQQEDVQCRLN